MTLVQRGAIELPRGAAPGFDHADVHLASGLLYVAHTGADRVEVVDCAAQRYRRSLEHLPGVAGVLVDQADDLLVSSDRAAARISLWRLPHEALLGRVRVDAHPNGLAYDRSRRRVFVFCLGNPPGHSSSLVVVDAEACSVVDRIPLPGRPRWAIHDPEADLVYANIREPAQIVVVDAGELRLRRALDVLVAGPHGLAIADGRLFCAADAGALVTLDAGTGDVLGEVPLPGEPDVLWHDPARERAYVSIGDPGCVCVIDTHEQRLVETVSTERGAHTSAWHPASRTLYALLPESCAAAVYVDEEEP